MAINPNFNLEAIQNPPGHLHSPTKISSPSPFKGKKWSIIRDFNGKIDPYPSPSIRGALFQDKLEANVIYRIKDMITGRRYIGSCLRTEKGNTIIKRLGNYKYQLNKENFSFQEQQEIVKAIKIDPLRFNFKIIAQLENASEPDLLALEEQYQDLYDTRNPIHGFNQSRPTQERLRSIPRIQAVSQPALTLLDRWIGQTNNK